MTKSAPRILFFVSDTTATDNDNQQLLPPAFARAGWHTAVAAHDSLRLGAEGITCSAGHLAEFNKIWLLGFGPRVSFFDRMQLLSQHSTAAFVNQPQALLLLHGKLQGLGFGPETHVSRNLADLLQPIRVMSDGW